MGFFTRKHTIPDVCIYDPYLDLESEIVGEVQRIIKNQDIDDQLPDFEKFLREHEEERKHLVKLFEIAEGCDIQEMCCFLMVARKQYPNLYHAIDAKADKEQREKLEEYEKLSKGAKEQ